MALPSNAQEALGYIRDAGFPADQQATALAIATAESGLDYGAVSGVNFNGTQDVGLFQISVQPSDSRFERLRTDPLYNAQVAYSMSSGGTNWRPWCTYWSGGKCGVGTPGGDGAAFKKFLADAIALVGGAITQIPKLVTQLIGLHDALRQPA